MAKELTFVMLGAILILGIVGGAMWIALVYLPSQEKESNGVRVEASVNCEEEDMSGVCGVRKFLKMDR